MHNCTHGAESTIVHDVQNCANAQLCAKSRIVHKIAQMHNFVHKLHRCGGARKGGSLPTASLPLSATINRILTFS